MKIVLFVLLATNTVAFLAFGLDKWQAVSGGRRISERRLLQLAVYLGGIGAWLGSRTFRHKTKKPTFLWRLRLALAVNLVLLAGIAWVLV